MKRIALYLGIAALVASCSTREMDIQTPIQDDVVFYASFEQPAEEGTRVYANEDLLLRWTADDRVSIFNKLTYNQQYKFTGETGDNAGGFRKVDSDEFVTGNAISHVVSVYPYQEATKITESEVLTVTLPAEQLYAENTFGLGANTMVSVSSDNVLMYKNVGGYLRISLYGEGVSVSSITLKGNNGEKLAGKASISMPLDGTPTTMMAENATTEITLTCPDPIVLGATEEGSRQFWFVVPPMTFEKGFTIIVKDISGEVFVKSTSNRLSIERNKLSKMVPVAVVLPVQLNNEIWYTTSDENPIVLINNNFDANVVSNEYKYGKGVITFDNDITFIGDAFAWVNSNLTSIILPKSIASIGEWAFAYCTGLTSISLPVSLKSIGTWAFYGCESLASITLPDTISSIGEHTFWVCKNLTNIIIPDSVESIGVEAFRECSALNSVVLSGSLEDGAFYDCTSLIEITFSKNVTSIGQHAFHGCISLSNLLLPDSVTSIGSSAFFGCSGLSSIIIPEKVTSIGSGALSNCSSLSFVTIIAETPPSGEDNMFDKNSNYPIYVPAVSVDAYKTAQYWSDYADRIQAIGTPEAIDLGLSVKWASFNLGASRPEEYGNYYAWGETEPYYSCQDPLTWKEDKTAGYNWASYKWCMGLNKTITKYCYNSSYGFDGFTDTKTVLDLEDDAAHVTLGGNWRMPTDAEWTELRENCTWTWTTRNGVNGRLVTATNGNSIFLPAAGYRNHTDLRFVGSDGCYRSSSLSTDCPDLALDVYFYSDLVSRSDDVRYLGFSIRPVCD